MANYGNITINNIRGGTVPYVININGNGINTSVDMISEGGTAYFDGLTRGTYNITITDFNGCVVSKNDIYVAAYDDTTTTTTTDTTTVIDASLFYLSDYELNFTSQNYDQYATELITTPQKPDGGNYAIYVFTNENLVSTDWFNISFGTSQTLPFIPPSTGIVVPGSNGYYFENGLSQIYIKCRTYLETTSNPLQTGYLYVYFPDINKMERVPIYIIR